MADVQAAQNECAPCGALVFNSRQHAADAMSNGGHVLDINKMNSKGKSPFEPGDRQARHEPDFNLNSFVIKQLAPAQTTQTRPSLL